MFKPGPPTFPNGWPYSNCLYARPLGPFDACSPPGPPDVCHIGKKKVKKEKKWSIKSQTLKTIFCYVADLNIYTYLIIYF